MKAKDLAKFLEELRVDSEIKVLTDPPAAKYEIAAVEKKLNCSKQIRV